MTTTQAIPACSEVTRLAALDRYGILDTPTEAAFDAIVRLVADLLDAPIAAVNLIAGDRQWFKAEIGLGVREMPLDDSICRFALLEDSLMVVPDTTRDARFACNPLVTGAPGLRFYAGALLRTPEGIPLGTLCVLDVRPRPEGMTAQQRLALCTLGDQVMALLELGRTRAALAAARHAAPLSAAQARLRSSEAARRAGEQRYHTVLKSIDVGFCVIDMIFDAAGDGYDYRIIEVNDAFTRHTGLADAAGKTIRALIPTHDVRWSRLYGRVAKTGLPVRIEQHTANLGRWLDIYAARLGDADSRQVAVFLRDVSEERARNETLRQLADDLAEANRRQSEFLATLAHELRNPLAPVRTGLDLLRLGADQPAVLARVRPMMERQVNHLVHLVDDLLDLARINSGKVELKKAVVPLKDIVLRAIEMTQPLIEARGHDFHVDVGDEPLSVHADATRLAQVIGNLLTNAAKYTPGGGSVSLAVRREGGRVRIDVADSGVGIPADALPRIFDMFTQVGRHPQQESGGLGIGLHLVRQMTELHGGTVGAHSAGPGRGSTFVVELPLVPGAGTIDASAAAGDRAVAAGLRIVLADDNADAAELLRDVLAGHGHAVEVVGDGHAALDAAQRVRPDVALLDIGMPGLSGLEVARSVRAHPQLRAMRLVALSGWGTAEDRARSAAAGFDCHLTKPVEMQALLDAVAGRG
jgi:signal transduction histidine kinase